MVSKYNDNKKDNKSFGLFNEINSIKFAFQKQINIILEDLNEKNHIIQISISHLHIFECYSRIDFEDIVLGPIIQQTSIKRNLDFVNIYSIISSRIIWGDSY